MDCFQISVVASPGPYAQTFFFNFGNSFFFFFFDFLGFFFVFVNKEPYGSQNFKTLLVTAVAARQIRLERQARARACAPNKQSNLTAWSS